MLEYIKYHVFAYKFSMVLVYIYLRLVAESQRDDYPLRTMSEKSCCLGNTFYSFSSSEWASGDLNFGEFGFTWLGETGCGMGFLERAAGPNGKDGLFFAVSGFAFLIKIFGLGLGVGCFGLGFCLIFLGSEFMGCCTFWWPFRNGLEFSSFRGFPGLWIGSLISCLGNFGFYFLKILGLSLRWYTWALAFGPILSGHMTHSKDKDCKYNQETSRKNYRRDTNKKI